mgnify:CR=1 FL=1
MDRCDKCKDGQVNPDCDCDERLIREAQESTARHIAIMKLIEGGVYLLNKMVKWSR